MDMDLRRIIREEMRGKILQALYLGQPFGLHESTIQAAMSDIFQNATEMEVRKEMDYLEERGLIAIGERHRPAWFAKLTRDGVDVFENTVPCDPGIRLPKEC
jgi:hypothetical protein